MQAQISTATLANRYGNIFQVLQETIRQRYGNDLGGEGLRILSFGCSTGLEVLSVRAYFPHAEILGCDINTSALNASIEALSSDLSVTFLSTADNIRAFGPYDIILANAVLCSYPASARKDNLSADFPFSRFVDLAEGLIGALKPDGHFVLMNSNYFFSDLPSAGAFQPVVSHLIEGNGFVEKFGKDSKKIATTPIFNAQREYAHKIIATDKVVSDADFRDAIFVRGKLPRKKKVSFHIEIADILQPDMLIMGSDPDKLQERGLIGAGLFKRLVRTTSNDIFSIYQWHRTMMDGTVMALGENICRSYFSPEHDHVVTTRHWHTNPSGVSQSWSARLRRSFSSSK